MVNTRCDSSCIGALLQRVCFYTHISTMQVFAMGMKMLYLCTVERTKDDPDKDSQPLIP